MNRNLKRLNCLKQPALLCLLLAMALLCGCMPAGGAAPAAEDGPGLAVVTLPPAGDTAEPAETPEPAAPAPELTEAPETQEPEPETAADPAPGPEAVPTEEPVPFPEPEPEPTPEPEDVTEDGEYSSPEEVAEYLHRFGHLPGNYISKREAQDLGWNSREGNLWEVAPGKSIGGDSFGNREGLLPQGRYHECDVNFDGGFRGSERLIYGEDGSIWYTSDHYESFTQLY